MMNYRIILILIVVLSCTSSNAQRVKPIDASSFEDLLEHSQVVVLARYDKLLSESDFGREGVVREWGLSIDEVLMGDQIFYERRSQPRFIDHFPTRGATIEEEQSYSRLLFLTFAGSNTFKVVGEKFKLKAVGNEYKWEKDSWEGYQDCDACEISYPVQILSDYEFSPTMEISSFRQLLAGYISTN